MVLLNEILHMELPGILMEDNAGAICFGGKPKGGTRNRVHRYLLALN
jgi:hypothetical protein